jgi:general secretion pathway protein K
MKHLRQESGMVLLVVLLVVTLLASLLSEFAFSVLVDMRLAETYRDSTRGYYLARGGVTVGRMFLLLDKESNGYDAPNDPSELWAQGLSNYPVGDGYLSIQVEDLCGKLNLNLLFVNGNIESFNKARFIALCDELGLVNGIELADALIDWLDSNEDPGQYGAESSYYQSLDHPYPAKNAPIDTLEELSLIMGFDGETMKKLVPHVTLFGNGDLNVNTASRELLTAVFVAQQMNIADAESAAGSILAKREEGPITSDILSQLATLGSFATNKGLGHGLDVKSTALQITSDAEVNDGRRTFTAVVDHKGGLLQQRVD